MSDSRIEHRGGRTKVGSRQEAGGEEREARTDVERRTTKDECKR